MKFPISNFQFPLAAPSGAERGLSQSAAGESRGGMENKSSVRCGEALRVGTPRAPGHLRRSAGILPAGKGASGRLEAGAPVLLSAVPHAAAFTMIEVAISLAIIGFALVAIIGVLPYGLNTQRDNREETVINQDATVLIEAIRNGAYGYDELTNNVFAITNDWQQFDNQGKPTGNKGSRGYTYDAAFNNLYLTNGARIIGLLSTPQFTAGNNPGGIPLLDTFDQNYVSNHVTAMVRSLSGLAAEKPPQDNQIMREDTFTYRIYAVNAPLPQDTNTFSPTNVNSFATQLAANQRDLRLAFYWPVQPNGKVGGSRHTFRTTIGGQLLRTNDFYGMPLYFYQPQRFQSQ